MYLIECDAGNVARQTELYTYFGTKIKENMLHAFIKSLATNYQKH